MSKKIIIFSIVTVLLVASVLAGITLTNNSEKTGPIQVVDSAGTTHTFQEPCEKAIVFSKYIGEAMILMGVNDKVVGTTTTIINDSNYKPYYTNAVDLGTKPNGDTVVSKIAELQPDVIFSYKSEDNNAIKATGVPVVEIGAAKIIEVVNDITVLGKIMGEESAAKKILDWFEPLYQNFIDEKSPSEKTFAIESWSKKKLTMCNPTSTPGALFKIAGANNIYQGSTTYSYPSPGDVIPLNPDIYVVVVYNANWSEEENKSYNDMLKAREGWDQMSCVQDDQIYFISNDIIGGIRSIIGAMFILSLYDDNFNTVDVEQMVADYNNIAGTTFNKKMVYHF